MRIRISDRRLLSAQAAYILRLTGILCRSSLTDVELLLPQIYKQGAACDTTGGLRTAAVGFECGSGERAEITSVHEPASCMYFITVAVPELCQHPGGPPELPGMTWQSL